MKQLQPKAIYKAIAGTGHFIQLEKPDEVNSLLNDFLKSTFAGSASRRK